MNATKLHPTSPWHNDKALTQFRQTEERNNTNDIGVDRMRTGETASVSPLTTISFRVEPCRDTRSTTMNGRQKCLILRCFACEAGHCSRKPCLHKTNKTPYSIRESETNEEVTSCESCDHAVTFVGLLLRFIPSRHR